METRLRSVLSARAGFFAAGAATAMLSGVLASAPAAHALSDDLPEYRPDYDTTVETTPLTEPDEAAPEPGERQRGDAARPDTRLDKALPEVIYDLDRLPEPVRRMRARIIEACRSGDLEQLRPYLGSGAEATRLSLGPLEGDPIEFLREISGDEEGQEILAILLEVLESGFVRLNAGTDYELYVWPYFFALPLDSLTSRQRVELFTVVTAGDYEDMKDFGAYIFYRAAITPDGRWQFFVAGD
ncbi:cytoplasmic protein [Chelativorans sp. M5D2P16]|uniref:cytoplasmic protein n=1 Tax=Chelativorans sp. M5D2P16 TaxID=3095678 RepID=UPI002ACAD385|nr:cytoplasmic protein [Chelativorans sp. M5D2P16]MDZ5696254.1 cytoplasmic protein [Chelativorans sp. M5D2P16]